MTSTRKETEEGVRAGAEVDRLLETASRSAAARKSRPSAAGGLRWSVLDPVEALYREAGHWGELCELYLQRLDVAKGDAERAKLLRRTGTILCDQLGDAPQALEAFTEALIHEPDDEATIIALEALASALSAWESVIKDVTARLDADPGGPRELALCAHLVRWTKRYLERPADAEPLLARIRKIDPTHSAIHARMASVYRERGAFREQKDELETALLSATASEERRLLHLALADLNEGRLSDPAAAIRHLEAALLIDPKGIDSLVGLERLFLAEGRHADVIGVLERQIEVASDDDVRVASLTRLADVYERIFVKPERAAIVLERAIELAPESPSAFQALERCYRAARAWTELARVTEVQARATTRPDRLRKLFDLAEIFEAKLGDAAGALRVYREIAQLDSRSTEAFAAIARLCERGEDWNGAVLARKRLAELAPTAGAKAKIHLAIGEALLTRDPKQAQTHFERAAAIDPTCAAAWDALVDGARRGGASDRLAEYLEQRIAHTEAPRLRAELLVELADARRAVGEAAAAEAAEEDATVVDPGNEAAARRVLPRYVAASRWAEALPLCERLVNAALRDGDAAAASAQRRTLARIALGLDDPSRAVTAVVGAYELCATPACAEDVVDVCHRVRVDLALVERARPALDAISTAPDELSPAALAKLGELATVLGSPDAAVVLFRQALAADPCCEPALAGLTKLATEPAAFQEAAEYSLQAAANAESRSDRFRLLVDAGELLAFRAGDLAAAAAAFEEARATVPRDRHVLHTLVWVYTEIEAWGLLTDVLRSIADSETEPTRRAKGMYAMALVLRDKVGDPKRAASAFEQVLDLDPTRLEAFERLVRVHTERRDWGALAKAYEKMILRARPPEGEVEQRHALFFQLGLVYRDRVGDVPHALQAFRSAALAKPGNATTRKALVELQIIAGRTTDAFEVVRGSIALYPADASACLELCDVAMRLGAFDHAWRAIDAARVAGASLSDDAERFHRNYGVPPLSNATSSVAPADWKRLFHPKLDPLLTGLYACVARAVLRSPRVRATREQAASALPLLERTTADAARVAIAVNRGAQLLGVSVPPLYACKTSTPLEGLPTAPGLLVSVEACSALGDAALAFLIGKHLAAREPEIHAAALFPTLPELGALLAAALHTLETGRGGEAGRAGEAGPFDRIVREVMTPEERETIRSIAATARAKDARFDVAQWKRFADASAARVGLLLAGSLDGARRAMNASPQATDAMSPRDQLDELLVMSLGDTYSALRSVLGVAVSG